MPSLNIRFEDADIVIDRVVVAVALIDAFTGQVVRDDIKVTIEGLFNAPIRNLTGMFVFVNLPPQDSYQINIDAEEAGYFSPEPIEFTPPADDDPEVAKKRRLDVPLIRRPSAPQDLAATSITGVVVRSVGATREPAPFVSIRAEFPEDLFPPGGQPDTQFNTLSDERGAFTLSMRLPPEAGVEAVVVQIIFEQDRNGIISKRVVERLVEDQVFYSFDMSIDIEGPDIPVDVAGPGVPDLIEVPK